KGIPAALFMAKLSAEARFCMLTNPDPATAVSRLNDALGQGGMLDRFVTLAAVVLDPLTHAATIVNAGHMAPMIYRRAGNRVEDAIANRCTGLPLGVLEHYAYDSSQVALEPGDCILIYSDGITDAMNVKSVPFHVDGIKRSIMGGPASATVL